MITAYRSASKPLQRLLALPCMNRFSLALLISFTVKTKQRFINSSTSIAVVVSISIIGPLTLCCLVANCPSHHLYPSCHRQFTIHFTKALGIRRLAYLPLLHAAGMVCMSVAQIEQALSCHRAVLVLSSGGTIANTTSIRLLYLRRWWTELRLPVVYRVFWKQRRVASQ